MSDGGLGVLNARTLYNASAAIAVGAARTVFPTDFRNCPPSQSRMVVVPILTAGDTIQVYGSVDGTNWVAIGTAISTAGGKTSWTDPWPFISFAKTGTAGTALVQGVL